MGNLRIAELEKACEEFGLKVEIVETEDKSGPMLVLSGGLPSPESIREINRRLFQIDPGINKILLEIPGGTDPTDHQ